MDSALTVGISWLGVVVAALALFVLGGIWFTALFGRAYRRELGVPDPGEGESGLPPGPSLAKALVGQFLSGLVIALVLAWLIGNTSAAHGALVGLGAGVLVAAALTQLHQFEGRSLRHLFITAGYMILGITAIGAILGAFQAA